MHAGFRESVCVFVGLGLGGGGGGGVVVVVKKQETSRHKELRGKGEGSEGERACPVTHCSRMCSVNASHCQLHI